MEWINNILTDANVQNAIGGIISILVGLAVAEYKKYVKGTALERAAYEAWNIVEEYFRLNPDAKTAADSKIKMFNNILRQKFPKIKQFDLEWMNKAVAGEINNGKCAQDTITLATPDINNVTVDPTVKYYTTDGKELILKGE